MASPKENPLLDLRSAVNLTGTSVAIAYSGGPDAAALASRLQTLGAEVIPVYVAYRNFGGKTAKDLKAAKLSASKLRLPTELIDSPLVRRITAEDKPRRNRIMVDTISGALAAKPVQAIALGTFKDTHESSGQWTEESNADIDPDVLAKIAWKRRHRLITWDSFGVGCKSDQFRGLSPSARRAIFATTSCQMWWKLECGNCYSCVERHEALLTAFGRDPTPYRPQSRCGRRA